MDDDNAALVANRWWSGPMSKVLLRSKTTLECIGQPRRETYCYLIPVGSWRIYIIMVIGAHDSMIIIKNGGKAIYDATLVKPSLVSPAPFGKINKHQVHINCII